MRPFWHNPNMSSMGDRLRKARLAAKFRSARSAALRHGWTESTYAAHENGQNDFDEDAALKYARAYKVSAGWLLTGETPPPASVASMIDQSAVVAVLEELCRRAGMSDNGAHEAVSHLVSAMQDRAEPVLDRRTDDLRAVTAHIARRFLPRQSG